MLDWVDLEYRICVRLVFAQRAAAYFQGVISFRTIKRVETKEAEKVSLPGSSGGGGRIGCTLDKQDEVEGKLSRARR